MAGVVAEYNPFHLGHALQLATARAAGCTHVAVVMSGNFVQRGEPAVCGKALRARAALENGADLVTELPLPWAISSAEGFARGAVSLLRALGCVDVLSFGSETGDADAVAALAAAYDAAEGSPELKTALKTGEPFARARQRAAEVLTAPGPNDLLAAEYLRAAGAFGWAVTPLAVRRVGAGHDAGASDAATTSADGDGPVSASFLRGLLEHGEIENACGRVPPAAAVLLQQAAARGELPFDYARFALTELAYLRRLTPMELAAPDDVGEGLQNRLYAAIRRAGSLEEALALAKTKRYAHSRLRRALLSAYLGVGEGFRRTAPPYLRVLGFNSRGRELLRQARRAGLLPIVTRTAQVAGLSGDARRVFALECRAADLYTLALPVPGPCGSEQRFSPICLPG